MNIKNLLRSFCLLLFLGNFAFGQQQWTPQQSHTDRDLEEIFFVNAAAGWAFGETDGGQTGNNIRHTSDSGINWLSQGIGRENAEINAAWMFDTLSGIVVGRHSPDHNEGRSLPKRRYLMAVRYFWFEEELNDIFAIHPPAGSPEVRYVAFSSMAAKTGNLQKYYGRDLYGIYFSDHSTASPGETITVLHTADGGSWQKVNANAAEPGAAFGPEPRMGGRRQWQNHRLHRWGPHLGFSVQRHRSRPG
ncbi:MAG: hypothetical protein R3C61_03530 [Bacteroidia bacterium]